MEAAAFKALVAHAAQCLRQIVPKPLVSIGATIGLIQQIQMGLEQVGVMWDRLVFLLRTRNEARANA
ncbi:hypothetical protein D3C72_2519720 [compost metagenome]